MKTTIYSANERGSADYGWLKAKYSFSFANYYNPQALNFGALRVLNDDVIQGGMGFGTHPHDNMEIITIPLAGALKHKDSMSNQWIPIKTGEVQVMSAGTGIQHSEMNNSLTEELSLFQIWIIPNRNNVEPKYEQKFFLKENRLNKLQYLVSSIENPIENSLIIHQDAQISRIDLTENSEFEYKLTSEEKGVFIMVIDGRIEIESNELHKRDAIGIEQTSSFNLKALNNCQLLFIEVPIRF
jgi:redox-sensitive bicupin YhaK (pirin superfamily)